MLSLTMKDLRGKVVVLHFWTFGCINCRHNLPYYNRWQSDLAKDEVRIIGVHTPETAAEADEKNVVARVRELRHRIRHLRAAAPQRHRLEDILGLRPRNTLR